MIGDNLIRIMKNKNISGMDLAKEASISTTQISRMRSNTSDPTTKMIKKLAIALECSSDNLLFSEEEMEPNQEMKMIFKEIEDFNDADREVAKQVLRALIIKSKTESISRL